MTNIDTALVERVARAIAKGCNLDPNAISPKAAESGHTIPEWMFFTAAAQNAIEALQSTREKKLEEALKQLLDNMGEGVLCVCQQAKDEAIAALSDGEREALPVQGGEEERARIVAWLRQRKPTIHLSSLQAQEARAAAADAIERGDHLPPPAQQPAVGEELGE